MEKNTGNVREICQSENVGIMERLKLTFRRNVSLKMYSFCNFNYLPMGF